MKNIYALCSIVGLLLTLVPSILVFTGSLSWRTHTQLMFFGMVLWFVFAPFWMKEKSL